MNSVVVNGDGARVSLPAAWLAIAAAATTLVLLASLHMLSPEFDPAWRMVSEYANGRYGWVLSLMFAAWGVSTLALAVAIRAAAGATRFKVGVALLAVAGVGEALASVFDLNHDTLHSLAGALGIPCLPLAALLISGSLARSPAWAAARRLLLWTAHLTWISVALWAASFPLMVATFMRALGHLPAAPPKVLPPGVIALVGWTNRLFILAYVIWVLTVARQAIKRGTATPAPRERDRVRGFVPPRGRTTPNSAGRVAAGIGRLREGGEPESADTDPGRKPAVPRLRSR